VTLRIAVKATLTAKALPLSVYRQSHHFAVAESGRWPSVSLGGQKDLAKIIDHGVKSGQEGVGIDHRTAPYLGEDGAILQVEGTFRSS
jgi:hypothetical protein